MGKATTRSIRRESQNRIDLVNLRRDMRRILYLVTIFRIANNTTGIFSKSNRRYLTQRPL